MKKKIAYIIGTRPDIIRSARVIQKLKKDPQVDLMLIHTGQHYDYGMSQSFLKELGIPNPDTNLHVSAGGQGNQTGEMIMKLEEVFKECKPDMVVVFGDTNSSLAGALAAVKLQIPLAHLEAGPREWDMTLPEEVNRRIIDHISNLNLAVSESSVKNLKDEKVLGVIFNTGDPLYEVWKSNEKQSRKLNVQKKHGLKDIEYIFLTVHRAHNVNNPKNLKNIIDALQSVRKYKIVFPIHPRTKAELLKLKYPKEKLANFLIIDPVTHQEVLSLIRGARMVVTDSGGLQKEVFWSKIPCITLRTITAWSETVDLEVNFLAGTEVKDIRDAIEKIDRDYKKIGRVFNNIKDPYYKKNTIERTVSLIKKFCNKPW